MSEKSNFNFKKILIVGDSGRGKSTFAGILSKKLNIKQFSTDDFYWRKKYSVVMDKETSLKNISKIYNQKSWIIEGATRSLIREGIEKSDKIICLVYPNLLFQFWTLFKRKLTRKEETWSNLFNLYKHLFYKKYKLGQQINKDTIEEMLKPFSEKTIKLYSFREIDNFIQKLQI